MYQRKFMPLILIMSLFLFACEKERAIDEPENLVPLTVDQDQNLPSILVNGALLHAQAFGHPDSALVVVLHGGPGNDHRYLLNCQELSDHGYRVVFYDQRGSGLSERFSKDSYSLSVLEEELTGVIEYYRTSPAQKVFLLGHSWGAMLAGLYVDKNPDAIDGLVLAEPGGLVWQDVLDYVGRSRALGITNEVFNDLLYTDQFITGNIMDHEILDYKMGLQSFSEGGEESITGNQGVVPFWRLGAVISQAMFEIGNAEKPDWTRNLNQFSPNILFIYGENNTAYGKEWAEKVASPFPNVTFFQTVNAGHDMLSFDAGWNSTFPEILNYLNNLK